MRTNDYTDYYTITFFGRRRPVTPDFKEWLENTDGSGVGDFFILREAVYEQESRGQYLVQTKFGKTYVGEHFGDLVLMLTANGRDAFLRDLNRSCKRAKYLDD
jgi:hypothetical protein